MWKMNQQMSSIFSAKAHSFCHWGYPRSKNQILTHLGKCCATETGTFFVAKNNHAKYCVLWNKLKVLCIIHMIFTIYSPALRQDS